MLLFSFGFLFYSLFKELGKPTRQDKADELERNWKHTPAKEQHILFDADVDSADIVSYYRGIYDSILVEYHPLKDSIGIDYLQLLGNGKDTMTTKYIHGFKMVHLTSHKVLTKQQFMFIANYEEPETTPYSVVITYDKTKYISPLKRFIIWLKSIFT